MLHGRGAETEAIAALLATSQNGRSGVLVIRGEAGIGKTALLDWAAQQAMPAPSSTAPGMTAPGMTAPGMTVLRSTGIETEAELPFAGLHLLLRPVLGRLDALPARQAEALSRAFFLVERDSQGGDDRFLVGLAVLSLLAEAGPVLCLIDDANWLDAGSAEALLFAARRLEAEGVVMIFAARDGEARPFPAAGLPECSLAPLTAGPASRLIDERVPALDQGLRDRVLTDAQGNPLALAELAGALLTSAADGRSAEPGPLAATRRVRERFAAEIRALGDQAKLGLLVAAAEGSGGTQLILDAAGRLGAGPGALTPAESAGLITVTQRITFRHPLIRSAAYYEAPLALRQAAHRALAAALQPGTADDDRRAWHQAAAATGADEQIAAELVRAAEHARERGGYTAVAAAYGRAAQLTPDPAARARRLLAGAAAATDVGQADWAVQLADEAQQLCDDPLVRAEAAYLRTLGHAGEHDSLVRLGTAAVAIAEEYPPRAAELLGRVLNGAWASSDHPLAAQTADQLRHLPLPSGTLRQADQALLQQVLFLAGDGAANRSVISAYLMAVRANPGSARPHERLTATVLAFHVGDLDALSDISGTLVADCRAGGLIGWLAGALQGLAMSQVIRGDWADARASATEGLHLADDTGHQRRATFMLGMLGVLAALTGDEHQCRSMLAEQRRRGGADPAYEHNLGSQLGLLELSRARFSSATERFASASLSNWVGGSGFQFQPDMVEAATRAGQPDLAQHALGEFETWAGYSGQRWAAALVARCRALISGQEAAAEKHFTEAIELHEGDGRPFQLARTRLLYGEWLRREMRRSDAGDQLTAALDTFEQLGAASWADRARAELHATGLATLRVREPGPLSRLTPQEFQIARLAATGISNRDIATQLFLSHRTVGYHLYKAYPKLGITARAELAPFFPGK